MSKNRLKSKADSAEERLQMKKKELEKCKLI